MTGGVHALVVHPGGALGDFVLSWPLLRVLRDRDGASSAMSVGVVSASSRAALAASVLDVTPRPDHLPPWSGLWRGEDGGVSDSAVRLLISLGDKPPDWIAAARRTFPGAKIVVESRTLDRPLALELAASFGGAKPVVHGGPVRNPDGPIVLHAGSGGLVKQWPLRAWVTLKSALETAGGRCTLIAGEAEQERWPEESRRRLIDAGGRFVTLVSELAELLSRARMHIGCDSGPSHLAAQLCVPTLVLFGPTDPRRWSPIGPFVSVVRSPDATMNALGVDAVLEEAGRMLEKLG